MNSSLCVLLLFYFNLRKGRNHKKGKRVSILPLSLPPPRRYSQNLPPPKMFRDQRESHHAFPAHASRPDRLHCTGQVERPLECLPLFEVLPWLTQLPQGLFYAKPHFFQVQVPSNLCCFCKHWRSKNFLARAALARIKWSMLTVLLYSINREQKKEKSQNQHTWTRENTSNLSVSAVFKEKIDGNNINI